MRACPAGSPIVCGSGFDRRRVIGGRRPLQGQKPGDRRFRVDRPHAALFRWTGPGQLTAKEAASIPATPRGRVFARAKALLLGRPLASVIVLIPVLVGLMNFVHRQYAAQSAELAVRDDFVVPEAHREQRVVIPVNAINRAVVQAVVFGRTLATDVRAVFITEDSELGDEFRIRWQRQVPGVPLVIVESPNRALVGPLTAYLDVLDLAWPPDKPAPTTIVVLPEFVVRHWWDRLLYNQSAKRLKSALVGREHTVIADVPYRRGH